MNNISINIWGRQFLLPIKYDVYPEESIAQLQKESIESFISKVSTTSDKNISEYVIQHDGKQIGEVIDNIFRYVMPRYFYVPLDAQKRVVAIMCDYRFDEEHGLAIIYENEILKEIGPQDIVL